MSWIEHVLHVKSWIRAVIQPSKPKWFWPMVKSDVPQYLPALQPVKTKPSNFATATRSAMAAKAY